MKKQIRWFTGIALIGLTGTSAFSSFAQQKGTPDRVVIERERVIQGPEGAPPPPHDRMIFEREIMPHGPDGPPAPGDFIFMATEMSFGGHLVKGAPYSAQAVTESVHTLSDGNRITNKSTAAIYRDSEGRTRREQTFKAIGPFANAGEPSRSIFISDPVAGTSYTLDPRAQVARKMAPMQFKIMSANAPPDGQKQKKIRIVPDPMKEDSENEENDVRISIDSDKKLHKKHIETGVAMGWLDARNPSARKESLGKQNIGGVEAEGTRTTVTIQAGEIGNERPIEIVSERWYSPELQVIVMTRHSDPRFGENTYQLTNINRTEPARELFEVPAGYTVKESPAPPVPPGVPMRVRKLQKNVE